MASRAAHAALLSASWAEVCTAFANCAGTNAIDEAAWRLYPWVFRRFGCYPESVEWRDSGSLAYKAAQAAQGAAKWSTLVSDEVEHLRRPQPRRRLRRLSRLERARRLSRRRVLQRRRAAVEKIVARKARR